MSSSSTGAAEVWVSGRDPWSKSMKSTPGKTLIQFGPTDQDSDRRKQEIDVRRPWTWKQNEIVLEWRLGTDYG